MDTADSPKLLQKQNNDESQLRPPIVSAGVVAMLCTPVWSIGLESYFRREWKDPTEINPYTFPLYFWLAVVCGPVVAMLLSFVLSQVVMRLYATGQSQGLVRAAVLCALPFLLIPLVFLTAIGLMRMCVIYFGSLLLMVLYYLSIWISVPVIVAGVYATYATALLHHRHRDSCLDHPES